MMKKPILILKAPFPFYRGSLLAGIVMAFFFLACGKKDLPIAPQTVLPPAVTNLQGQLDGDLIVLSWRLPDGKTAVDNGLYEFRIWRARQDLAEAPCPDCPVKFKMAERLLARDMVVHPDGALGGVYSEPATPGQIVIYHVTGYNRSGVAGDRSNTVRLICPRKSPRDGSADKSSDVSPHASPATAPDTSPDTATDTAGGR